MSAPILTKEQVKDIKRTWPEHTFVFRLADSHEALRAERDAALAEVARLRAGMEAWARDEDGIHPDAYPAYCSAGLLLGITPKEVKP